MSMPISLGLSESDTRSFAQNNPTSINVAGASSPVTWIIIGVIAIVVLVVWLKWRKR